MAKRELISDVKALVAIAPVVVTDNTAQASNIIDTQGYNSCAFLIQTGTLADADATFAITLTAGDASNLSDGVAVTSDNYQGDTAFTFADDNVTKKIAYKGSKRYVRVTITPTANAGNAPLAAVAVLGHSGTSAPIA